MLKCRFCLLGLGWGLSSFLTISNPGDVVPGDQAWSGEDFKGSLTSKPQPDNSAHPARGPTPGARSFTCSAP